MGATYLHRIAPTMDCFTPSSASGGFMLFAVLAAFGLGMAAYRWLLKSEHADKLAELERKAAEFDDHRRGR